MSVVLDKFLKNIESKNISFDICDSLTIRKATTDDAEAIQHITRESFKKYVKDSGLKGTIEALSESLDDIVKDIVEKDVHIFLLGLKPVGSIRVEILQSGSAYISRFGVLPEYHNLGIGKLLISHVESTLKSNGVKKVLLHTALKNKELINFYHSRGFYVHSTDESRGYVRALMIKLLE
jgi:ribosomal protein S18 acetylase RimI-like enzyme